MLNNFKLQENESTCLKLSCIAITHVGGDNNNLNRVEKKNEKQFEKK